MTSSLVRAYDRLAAAEDSGQIDVTFTCAGLAGDHLVVGLAPAKYDDSDVDALEAEFAEIAQVPVTVVANKPGEGRVEVHSLLPKGNRP